MTQGACEAALTGTVLVDIAFDCENPGTCQRPIYLGEASADTQITGTNNGNALAYTGVSLDFGLDDDTTAEFIMNYPDAGQMQLHARYTLTPGNEEMLGDSNSFVSRPLGFLVTASHPTAHATDEAGDVLTTAGSPFYSHYDCCVVE